MLYSIYADARFRNYHPETRGGAHLLDVTAAIISDSEGRILLARRPADDRHEPGKWEFPGGKVEVGESAITCLQRELREELGVETCIGDFVCAGIDTRRNIRLLAYWAHIVAGNIVPTVHDELRWIHPKHLLEYEMPPADLPIVQAIIRQVEQAR